MRQVRKKIKPAAFIERISKPKYKVIQIKPNIYRVIFGDAVENFVPQRNKHLATGYEGGSLGTMDLMVVHKTGEIMREVPLEHEGKGIGTHMLVVAEQIGRKIALNELIAHTGSRRTALTYIKAGWEKLFEKEGNYIYRKLIES